MNCYLWIPKKGEASGCHQNPKLLGRGLAKAFYPWFVEPKMVWSLIDYTDPEKPPEIEDDNIFAARVNCFREFPVHDYICYDNSTYIFFQSRFTNGGHWIMLVF